jgi:DNA-binding NarL/FixJ family response regulator
MNTIRVLIADDHALVRAGMCALLEKIDGVAVVGEAGKVSEAIELVGQLHPDLLLLDLTMPETSGFEVLHYCTTNFPDIRVIVLTVHEAYEYARRALNEGAAGFILKSAASTELEQAIQTVMRGEVYFRKTLIGDRKDTKKELLDSLSPRQREVLRLIAKGKTTKKTAQILGISPKTVESHRSQLMDRLNIRDVAGLVRFAISVGLVDPNDD